MPDKSRAVFHVPREMSGQPLAAVLRRWQSGKSWTQVRQLVRHRQLLLDGNLVTNPDQHLRPGQVLKLLDQPLAPVASDRDIRIFYRDADVVVIDKPAGMTSIRHPDEKLLPAHRRQHQPTITELLPRLLARVERNRGRQPASRPVRAVHRLDRETSGLMVFARNVKAERALGHQFAPDSIQRVYWAIAAGRVEEQTIETELVRDRGDGRRGSATRSGQGGKRAVTHVRPLEVLPGFTLVECRLETGRTHQIRIHLAELGHPVCGDRVYGPVSRRGVTGPSLGRLALHAGRLGFVHPTENRLLQFESPLPDDWQTFLNRLRSGTAPTPVFSPEPGSHHTRAQRPWPLNLQRWPGLPHAHY